MMTSFLSVQVHTPIFLNNMRLLIITQKVDINDSILGFFHWWIIEFAKHCEQVTVIALSVGEYDLPRSVRVFSLGKELGAGRVRRLFNFYRFLWRERKNYDVVFVHMNPIYVVLGGLIWKILRKRIGLWYTHKHVDLKLRVAAKFTDIIFTASRESFRLASKKVKVVGHGIDVLKFSPASQHHSDIYTIISVGRLSLTKKQHEMVEAFNILRDRGFGGRLVLIGGPVTKADIIYEKKVNDYIKDKKLEEHVFCVGPVSPDIAGSWYKKADMFVNLSETGSMDKAVLEAMASGIQVVVSNEAFKNILPMDNFIHKNKNEIDGVVSKVELLSTQAADPRMREYVIKNHSLSRLLPKIIEIIKQ